ncbi:hypothetical protein BGZ99_007737 [Dissophora globulifera]|uniref:Uncharacterized protein n=1 Tax=Dissophora globulifera TaxID=979702 RepID=A0A9P6UQD4_9FUNG|nr:hypothetical protein BGZ99_007737 [Dissophora globulifera]
MALPHESSSGAQDWSRLQQQQQPINSPTSPSSPIDKETAPLPPRPQQTLPTHSGIQGFESTATTTTTTATTTAAARATPTAKPMSPPYMRSVDGQETATTMAVKTATLPVLPASSNKPLPPRPFSTTTPTTTAAIHSHNIAQELYQAPMSQQQVQRNHPVSPDPSNRRRRTYSSASSSSLLLHQQQQQRQQQQDYDFSMPRISLEQPPPYSYSVGHNGSRLLATAAQFHAGSGAGPPTEEHLFQVQELTLPAVKAALNLSNSGTAGSTSGGNSSVPAQQQLQFICADPMHDQQYLLVGSANGLHSIDLMTADRQQQPSSLLSSSSSIRTHIQGLAFKEIHCLDDIGLVVVIAGRNSRVRCYDYDAIKRLVSYGHSKDGQGRVVEGGKLGLMKNMIQLQVETTFLRDNNSHNNSIDNSDAANNNNNNITSPGIQSRAARIFKNSSSPSPSSSPSSTTSPPQLPHRQRHQHTHSIDRSLLSPPLRSDSPNPNFDSVSALNESGHDVLTTLTSTTSSTTTARTGVKTHKQRPMSFGGLASMAQEHVMKSKNHLQQNQGQSRGQTQAPASSSTPVSPNTGNGNAPTTTKNKRLSQVASYFSQAAAAAGSTTAAAKLAASYANSQGQDPASMAVAPTEEAVSWAWDFTKLKQTKDVLGLDFHYTTSTVFMTILSKNGIDIYSRPRSARGRRAAPWTGVSSEPHHGATAGTTTTTTPAGTAASSINGVGDHGASGGKEAVGRPSTSNTVSGGMVTSTSTSSYASSIDHSNSNNNSGQYEWKQFKQLYHPEAPSFMTVVKTPQEVTDIILGKGPRACVINVESMSVTDIHREYMTNGRNSNSGHGTNGSGHSGSNSSGSYGSSSGSANSVIQGILGKTLGFKNSPLWHSFEKIPFDVPPYILYADAAASIYDDNRTANGRFDPDSKAQYATYGSELQQQQQWEVQGGVGGSSVPPPSTASSSTAAAAVVSVMSGSSTSSLDVTSGSRDEIIQKPWDQQSIHQQQLEEQERFEAETLASKQQQQQGLSIPQVYPANSSPASSSSSSSSSSNSAAAAQQPPPKNNKRNKTSARMVTSDEVINMHFCHTTTTQLFLATYGTHSRIVDLQGRPQSPVVLDWEASPPQKVEFLKSAQDIYVVGFDKASIVVFSLTRGKKVKTISKTDLVRGADTAMEELRASMASATLAATPSTATATATTTVGGSRASSGSEGTTTTSPMTTGYGGTTGSSFSNSSAAIKFLGRDNMMAEDSLGIFFSYSHPRNGISVCKLGIVPVVHDELELIGYYS